MNNVLLEKQVISHSCYSQENSPRVINPLGQKLYEQSGAKDLMEKVKGKLLKELETNKKIDSLLELERESLNTMLNRMDDKEFKNIQNFAFEHPKFEGNPLTFTDILFVMALVLRDLYRGKHPEINDKAYEADQQIHIP
ncbi:MAG: hypothetical protein Q8Q10_03475 [bacterium]|nr:hypothetical protein [bacterium]